MRHTHARVGLDAESYTNARVRLYVYACSSLLWLQCVRARTITICSSSDQSACVALSPSSPGGKTRMDCHGHLPRLAFGHLDQDGCLEEGGLTVDVAVNAVSGDRLFSIALKEEDQVQHLKTQISLACNVPESDQTLLLSNGQRLAAKRRLRSVLPKRSEVVTLVVSQPACRRCGVRDGLWGRRARLIQCALCLEAYYCSRECQTADAGSHLRCDRP